MRQRPQLLILVLQTDVHVVELLLVVVQRLPHLFQLSHCQHPPIGFAERFTVAPSHCLDVVGQPPQRFGDDGDQRQIADQ